MVNRLYNPSNQSPNPEKGRMRAGVPPDPAQQPLTFARLPDSADGSSWLLSWVRFNIGKPHARLAVPKAMPSDQWLNCKLHVDGRAKFKANYWVSLNPAEGRITSRWDRRALAEQRPSLEAALGALALHMKALEGLDLEHAKPMFEVRPNGEGWLIHDSSPTGRWRALLAELDAMTVGAQRSYALAELPMLREAKGAMHPKSFNGAPDPLTGGVLVTRTV
jgi:hypothetical protein